jgi:hypothetical protein
MEAMESGVRHATVGFDDMEVDDHSPLIVPDLAISAGFRIHCAICAFTGEPSVVSGTICRGTARG